MNRASPTPTTAVESLEHGIAELRRVNADTAARLETLEQSSEMRAREWDRALSDDSSPTEEGRAAPTTHPVR